MPITQDRLQAVLTVARQRVNAEKSLVEQVQILREKYFTEGFAESEKEKLIVIICNLVDDYCQIDPDDYFVLREEEIRYKYTVKKNRNNAQYVRLHRARKKAQQDLLTEQTEFQDENQMIEAMFKDVPGQGRDRPNSSQNIETKEEEENESIPDWASEKGIAERARVRGQLKG